MYWEPILGYESTLPHQHALLIGFTPSVLHTIDQPWFLQIAFPYLHMGFCFLISPRGQIYPSLRSYLTFTAGRATVPAENMDYSHWQIVQPIGGDHRSESSTGIGRPAAGGGAKAAFNLCLCLRLFALCAGYCSDLNSLFMRDALYFILQNKRLFR